MNPFAFNPHPPSLLVVVVVSPPFRASLLRGADPGGKRREQRSDLLLTFLFVQSQQRTPCALVRRRLLPHFHQPRSLPTPPPSSSSLQHLPAFFRMLKEGCNSPPAHVKCVCVQNRDSSDRRAHLPASPPRPVSHGNAAERG